MTTLFSEAALEFSRNAKARLDDDGFFHLEEISIRPLLSEMEKIGFSRAWGTPLALDFFTCILGDERVRATMDKVLGKCILAHSVRYWPYREGTAVSFLRGGRDTQCQGLIICVWPTKARHKYFRGSHLMEAEAKGRRTLWESFSASVEQAGCTGVEETFDEVSIVIADARTKFEMTPPYVIVMEVVQPSLITPSWVPMKLPKSEEMEKKLDALNEKSAPVGNLFTFDGTHPLFPSIDIHPPTHS